MKKIALIVTGCALLLGSSAFGQSPSDRLGVALQRRAAAQTSDNGKANILSVLLYTDITVQFQDTPARDAFNYLERYLGINIVARYIDDRNTEGIDPETPINLDVESEPALIVLEMVLDQCQDFETTTWQLRRGFLEVGTKSRLSVPSAQEIRYYPIRDLLFVPPMFDNAPELDISSSLDQGSFGGGGFGGGGGGFGGGGGGGGGFGRGGGGGGGGMGGGGSGGGGGGIFGDPGEAPDRADELVLAEELITIIQDTIEAEENADTWQALGGDRASIRFFRGVLIVRAPDYIHRQIGGYPFALRPVGRQGAMGTVERRYVTWTGGMSEVTNAGFRSYDVPGAVAP